MNNMKKLDKAIIWPIYFDANKTRRNGRRVAKNLAVQSPKIDEVKQAVDRLGLKNEIRLEAHFPRIPWVKTGMLLVEKKEAKEKIIQKIAKQLGKDEKCCCENAVDYAFSFRGIRTALIIPSFPGRLLTFAKPMVVSISAPLVMTPLRL